MQLVSVALVRKISYKELGSMNDERYCEGFHYKVELGIIPVKPCILLQFLVLGEKEKESFPCIYSPCLLFLSR